jgi:hypothetical protein
MAQERYSKIQKNARTFSFHVFVSNQIWLKQLMDENPHHLGYITKLKRKKSTASIFLPGNQ